MKTVLVIDDDHLLLELITEICAYEGYAVLTAHNGAGGLKLAQQSRIDLILCDWMMPNMGGYTLFRALQADRHTSHIPFMLMTGSTDFQSIQRWTGIPAEWVLPKPFEISRLLMVLRQATTLPEPLITQ
ncbi:MAG: response regulator [Armatimonadetes bacterium]|nr:response regulator [Anaerolineae bacterium]